VTRYDNANQSRTVVDPDVNHAHALTRDLAVGDASGDVRSVVLYDFRGEAVTSHELAVHDCTSHVQGLHVHPRIAPDGSSVAFTSDRLGYGNVYLAEIPDDISTLPRLE
jgi:oligogalacturonide lyase